MLIGYARVSTQDQNLNLQIDALKQAGCQKIYDDKISGTKDNRPGLEKALNDLRAGDTLVVWKLDRLGRTLKGLIHLVTDLNEKDIEFKSLKESIDTGASTGKLIFHIFGALAEFERDIIVERTKAGLEAARARGRRGGRKKKLTPAKIELAKKLHADKTQSIQDICDMLDISRMTLHRYVIDK